MVEVSKNSIEFIYCECGCQKTRSKYDSRGRIRKFIHSHSFREYALSSKKGLNAGPKSVYWKGGRLIDKYGYVRVYKPDHPNYDAKKYVLEHRLVMERYLGRYLEPREIVHHINGNKSDNRIENLELTTNQSEHIILHVNQNRLENILTRKCSNCGSDKTTMKNYNSGHRPTYNWHKDPTNNKEWWCSKCYSRYNMRRWRANKKLK